MLKLRKGLSYFLCLCLFMCSQLRAPWLCVQARWLGVQVHLCFPLTVCQQVLLHTLSRGIVKTNQV